MLAEVWRSLSPKQRLQAIAEFEAKKATAETAKSTSSSSSRVALATPLVNTLNGFPRMPTDNEVPPHRDKITNEDQFFNAAIARTVPKKELYSASEAQAAVTAEWDKLRKSGCWDESKVREWDAVAKIQE